MTHHSMSSVDLRGCPGTLRKGDIYTHTYHGWDTTITDQGGLALNPACIEARERGVLFDVSSEHPTRPSPASHAVWCSVCPQIDIEIYLLGEKGEGGLSRTTLLCAMKSHHSVGLSS